MIKLLKNLFLALFAAIYLAVSIPSAFAEVVVQDIVTETTKTAIRQKPDVVHTKSKEHKKGDKKNEKNHKKRKIKVYKKENINLKKPEIKSVNPGDTAVKNINKAAEKATATYSDTPVKNTEKPTGITVIP